MYRAPTKQYSDYPPIEPLFGFDAFALSANHFD
jgi:hypothetical protein